MSTPNLALGRSQFGNAANKDNLITIEEAHALLNEWVPNERIRYKSTFDDPNLPGEMQTTISLAKVSCGTELNVVQEGIHEAIPREACYLGWQESLVLLAKLVEAEIPG